MPSTFETLSDEILMIIFRYSDDVYRTFRTFLGLNQRLTSILIDKRSRLLTDFLYIYTGDSIYADYCKSDVFQNVCYQLSCMHPTISESQFRQCFQSLVTFHIKEQFMQLGDQVQSNLAIFNSMRQQLPDGDIVDIDNQLRKSFFDLRDNVITIKSIKQIESFVRTKSACLQCDNDQSTQFNLAKALNQLLLSHLNNIHSIKQPLIHPITKMLKALIISNTRVLMNRDHTDIEESSSVWYFLFYSIYQLQYRYYAPPDVDINMECYQSVMHLLLFAIQCQKQTNNNNENWAEQSLFDILNMMCLDKITNQNESFIESVQWEILKIIIEENVLTAIIPWQEDQDDAFRVILSHLINKNRLDVILLLYRRLRNVRTYFDKSNNIRKNVNILTGSTKGRELFGILMNEKSLDNWLISKDLLFLLLQKKERKFSEKLLESSSNLIHEVDEDGNNPLLYICLKVRGCRHRIIEFLIMIGCDLQSRNLNGENFIDAIQLQRNRSLRDELLDKEIVEIDVVSGEIQVIVRHESVQGI